VLDMIEDLKQVVKNGIEQNKIEMAKKMKLKNIPLQDISEITGLTKKEIENL